MSIWARHAIAHTKHISTCSGAPWHAVLNPAEWWRWVSLVQCETLDETYQKRARPEDRARCH